MGLVEIFKNAAVTAMNVFGNVTINNITYTKESKGYNVISGRVEESTTDYTIAKGIMGSVTTEDINKYIESKFNPTDSKLFFPKDYLEVDVETNDKVTINGIVYKIIEKELDSANALQICFIREV